MKKENSEFYNKLLFYWNIIEYFDNLIKEYQQKAKPLKQILMVISFRNLYINFMKIDLEVICNGVYNN